MEMTFEQMKKRLAICEKLIADFKIYDEKRKKYVTELQEHINELPSQKDMEKAQKHIAHLENENARLKKLVDVEHDAFSEFLDAYECAPGTVLNPKQKATYFELTRRVTQLKKDNRDLRNQMEEIIAQHTREFNALDKENKKELEKFLIHYPNEAINAELLLLQQKVTEKSVALKELRKWKKEATQFLSQHGLKVEFDKQKSQEYETD